MPKQGLDLGGPAAKCDKRLQRGPASPASEHFVPEPATRLRRQHALFLKQAVGVSGKHLGPLVAVIARGITAGENMAESVREAPILRRPRHDRELAPYRPSEIEHGPGIGIEI